MDRKMIDCASIPGAGGCTLRIAGRPDEVVEAAVLHGVRQHGMADDPPAREALRGSLRDEVAPGPDRAVSDCRLTPSISNCSLVLSGTEDEVVRTAVDHAVAVHEHPRTAELAEMVRAQVHESQVHAPTI